MTTDQKQVLSYLDDTKRKLRKTKMLTTSQIAKKKGVSRLAAWKWIKRHVPKNRIKVFNRAFFLHEKDVAEYLQPKLRVLQVDGDKIIRAFDNQEEAAKELGIDQGNLNKVLRGKRKTVAGLKFIFEKQD